MRQRAWPHAARLFLWCGPYGMALVMKALRSVGIRSPMRDRVPGTIVRGMAAVLLGVAAVAGALHQGAIAENLPRGVAVSVRQDGTLKIEAEGASVSEIIVDLSRVEGFEIEGDAPGEDVKLTRSLEGTLDELLTKLLREGNYVLISDDGVPRRLIILAAARGASPAADPSRLPGAESVQQLRQKENELVVLMAQYEDMSEEAREHANPEFARRFKTYAQKLSREVDAIRARLARGASNMQ
jgi:hypothetical protein